MMATMTYTLKRNHYVRQGEVHSRYVWVEVMDNTGQWSKPLVPMNRKLIVDLIEAEIRKEHPFLRGMAYRLTEVPSRLSKEAGDRLKQLRKG